MTKELNVLVDILAKKNPMFSQKKLNEIRKYLIEAYNIGFEAGRESVYNDEQLND